MKKLLILLIMVMAVNHSFASEAEQPHCKIKYSETDKKGNTVLSLETYYNDKFGTHVIRMVSDKLSGAVALSNDELQHLCNMVDDVKGIRLDAINPKAKKNAKMWDLYVFSYADKKLKKCNAQGTLGYKPTEDAANNEKCVRYIEQLKAFFKEKIQAYQKTHPQTTVVFYEFTEGANGLSGILRDEDGRIVDQTYYLCFCDDGIQARAMKIVTEKRTDATPADDFSRQLMGCVKFVKYEEPREKIFLTDAGSVRECAVFSDGRMVASSEHFYAPPMEWKGKKVGVDGLYGVRDLIEKGLKE